MVNECSRVTRRHVTCSHVTCGMKQSGKAVDTRLSPCHFAVAHYPATFLTPNQHYTEHNGSVTIYAHARTAEEIPGIRSCALAEDVFPRLNVLECRPSGAHVKTSVRASPTPDGVGW